MTIVFASVANSSDVRSRAMAVGTMALLMSLALATIWALDHPYGRGIRVPPLSFEVLLEAGKAGAQSP